MNRSIQLKGYGHCAACACSACTQVSYWKVKPLFTKDPIGSIYGILAFKKVNRLQLMNIDETGVDNAWISWFPGFMNGSLSFEFTNMDVLIQKEINATWGAVWEVPSQRKHDLVLLIEK